MSLLHAAMTPCKHASALPLQKQNKFMLGDTCCYAYRMDCIWHSTFKAAVSDIF